jgi:hypothetical protein
MILFEDEASFAQWDSLSYTWSRRGRQPEVPTRGKRKGYKVYGAIDYFTGRLFYQGMSDLQTHSSGRTAAPASNVMASQMFHANSTCCAGQWAAGPPPASSAAGVSG